LKDSNANPKAKTMEEKGVGVRSLAHNTLGVEGRVGVLGWGLGRMINESIIYTKQTTSWLVRNWGISDARMNHGHTWIHKTHHGPDLGEAITFPLIVFFVINHESYIQMSFCFGTPKLGVLKFSKLGFPTLWRAIMSYEDLRLR
jgi:hypothetical protein